MNRPRMLDVFCGEGGAAAGYYRAGYEVVGVDKDPARLKHYPFECHKGDAIEFILKYGEDFDLGHGSPTCTGYSQGTVAIPDRVARYDRLIAATREAFRTVGLNYVIENVEGAKRELVNPILLCGRMFGLAAVDDDGTPLVMDRHRMFESNLFLYAPPHETHNPSLQVAGAYGGARRDKWEARHVRGGGYVPKSLAVLRTLLDTPWMTEKGCFLSIPPCYTEYIGAQILEQMEQAA